MFVMLPIPTIWSIMCHLLDLRCCHVHVFEVGVGNSEFRRCTEPCKPLTIIYFRKVILPNNSRPCNMDSTYPGQWSPTSMLNVAILSVVSHCIGIKTTLFKFTFFSILVSLRTAFQSVKLMANKSCTTRKGFHSVCWLLSSKIMNSVSWVRFMWLSLYSRLLLSKIVTYLPFFQMYTSVFQQDSVSTTFLWHRHHSTCHVFHQVRNDPCSSSPFFLSFTEFLTQFIFRCN